MTYFSYPMITFQLICLFLAICIGSIIFLPSIQMDPDHDRKISEHVLRMHRYRKPGEQEGEGERALLKTDGRTIGARF